MSTVKTASFTPNEVSHFAQLANLPVSEDEKEKLADGFNTTIKVVNQLFNIDVSNVSTMSNVTGLINIFRDDVVDEKRMFTQLQALSNAKRTHKGYFVVKQVVEK